MSYQTNTRIDLPAFTHKLVSLSVSRATTGTGFIVDYADRSWLFTCWHNIGPAASDGLTMTGTLNVDHLAFATDTSVTMPLTGRRIVGIKINGVYADIAAIELQPHEVPEGPKLLGRRHLTLAGFDLDDVITLSGHHGGEGILLPVTAHYAWQGYPGMNLQTAPHSFLAADFAETFSQFDWMLRYTPGGYAGVSGGPVMRFSGQEATLAGVHVQLHHNIMIVSGKSTLSGLDIQARAELKWGSAVPTEPLFDAIERATGAGTYIHEVEL